MTPSGNGAENPLGKLVASCRPGWSRGDGVGGEKPGERGYLPRRRSRGLRRVGR